MEDRVRAYAAESAALDHMRRVLADEFDEDLEEEDDDDALGVCARVAENVERFAESGRIRVLAARCHVREGENERALDALARAVELGFEELEPLKGVPEFAAIVAGERFRELEGRVAAERSGQGGRFIAKDVAK